MALLPAASMITILAIDPGVTTGLCVARLNGEHLFVAPREEKFTLAGFEELLRNFCTYRPCHIIYEDFEYRNAPRAGLNLTPVKLIGIIELYAEKTQTMFYKQPASMGKAYFSDDKLRELGVYKKAMPHGRDATRHLLHWLQFRAGSQFIDEIEKLSIKLTN